MKYSRTSVINFLVFIGFVLAISVLIISDLPTTDAVCCHTYYPGICADCHKPGFFGNCGVDGCNIFGCACKGGCRQPPVGKKACAPTSHLLVPRLAKSEKRCWLMNENEKCEGREFFRYENYIDVSSNSETNSGSTAN